LIQEAIKKGDLERIKFYHMNKKMNFNQYNKNGESPFLMAARYRRLNILQYMLKKKIVNVKEDKSFMGDTALMIATFNKDFEMVKYLVEEEDVDVNCRDNRGYTPFIAACANNFMDLVIYFRFLTKADTTIRAFDKQSAAHRAAFYGNVEVLVFLSTYTTVRLNQPDKRGNLPIHYAAMNSHFSVCRYLYKLQENTIEMENKEKQTPLKILKANLDKIKKLKLPTSSVEEVEILNYMKDPKRKPFMIDSQGGYHGKDDARKPTHMPDPRMREGVDYSNKKPADLNQFKEDEERSYLKERRGTLPREMNVL
jgi:ankyrin repeat protein